MESTIMEYKGFKAKVMEAPRLTGEGVHQLPPGTPLKVYPVDMFEKAPENWMKGPGVFVIPVRPNKGLWFDWRDNSSVNTAVIPTVKGCNPITGMQTSGFHMERYDEKCPKHGCNFLAERFCPECNYKWPALNYIVGADHSPMWWDGFRSDDGHVRQFFFSEDELRDVASSLIGKVNTIPAFGFAFYSPKVLRQEPAVTTYRSIYYSTQAYGSSLLDGFKCGPSNGPSSTLGGWKYGSSAVCGASMAAGSFTAAASSATVNNCYSSTQVNEGPEVEVKTCGGIPDFNRRKFRSFQPVPVKEVSVGAGAKIHQDLNQDSYSLDSWKDTPDSVMTVYFIFQEKFEEIYSGGIRDLSGNKEGFLAEIPVG